MWWIIGFGFLATVVVIISAAYAKSPERKGKMGVFRLFELSGMQVQKEIVTF